MMNRQTNKHHCDLPHPPKSEVVHKNCKKSFDYEETAKQIERDMLHAFVRIVDTYNRLIIELRNDHAEQSSPPASCDEADSHAGKEVEEQDLN